MDGAKTRFLPNPRQLMVSIASTDTCVRRSLVEPAGGFSVGREQDQDVRVEHDGEWRCEDGLGELSGTMSAAGNVPDPEIEWPL